MKYKCIVADLDGTLLNSNKKLSQETKDTLELLMENGIHFVPATGRSFYAMPEDVAELKGIEYAITSNGVAVYDIKDRKAISCTCLSKQFVTELLTLLKDEEAAIDCVYAGRTYISETRYHNLAWCHNDTVKEEYIRATRTPVLDIREFMSEHLSEIEGIDITLPADRKSEIRTLIESSYPNIYITSSAPELLEISDIQCGKHNGIRKICELLNIDMSEVIAFGDNDNDTEMLLEAGLGVAVDNATESCKLAADMVTGSNDEDGVNAVLRSTFAEISSS